MNTELVQQLISAAALALLSLIGYALRSLIQVGVDYLKAKLGQANYQQLRTHAEVLVRAVEQSPIYKDLAGDKKYELVRVAILQFASEHGLPIDDAMVEKFIEAAVQEMNTQMAKIDWEVIGTSMGPVEPLAGGVN